jgi:tRNA A37 threonylcarbamoyladenosine biosynthesis protein TsaE
MLQKINLYSLYRAISDFDKDTFESYLKFHSINIKTNELSDLTKCIAALLIPRTARYRAFEYFSFGFIIPQIGKEFDLLRFGTRSIINIELKSESTQEKIKNQLVKNKYYLRFLNLTLYLFTYVSSENKFYTLNDKDELHLIDISRIITLLNRQFVDTEINLSTIFNPSEFLVSPFNSTEKFINKEYFLTGEQDQFKKKIIRDVEIDNKQFIVVKGQPGSGKTLLIYDLAEYFARKKNIVIIHCANLNKGQVKLIDTYDWNIISIKHYAEINSQQNEIIIIDETQRIRKNQLELIIDYAKKNNTTIIFSYDEKQVLQFEEKMNKIPEFIQNKTSPEMYTLTSKVRTNKEITGFIKSLFDRSRIIEQYQYESVELVYLNNMAEAKAFMTSDIVGDWTLINYTPSLYGKHTYEDYHNPYISTKTHSIIGQEFDKVIVVVDQDFRYQNDSLVYTKKCHYNPGLMLYQNITRARNKIKIVIINNVEVMKRSLQILNIQKK